MSRLTRGHMRFLPVRGYHPLWRTFPDPSGSYACATGLVRFRSPLLSESRLMSFPPGTEMFHFPGFAFATYVFSCKYRLTVGFPIRTFTDQSLIAAPRDLSQRTTSFIASDRLGIHKMHLDKRYAVTLSCSDSLYASCFRSVSLRLHLTA